MTKEKVFKKMKDANHPEQDFEIIIVPKQIEVSERYNVTETINVPRIALQPFTMEEP